MKQIIILISIALLLGCTKEHPPEVLTCQKFDFHLDQSNFIEARVALHRFAIEHRFKFEDSSYGSINEISKFSVKLTPGSTFEIYIYSSGHTLHPEELTIALTEMVHPPRVPCTSYKDTIFEIKSKLEAIQEK